jgi:hypothetical protein
MKPGAHLLAFAGTRTQHRMAVRIEDAGFEIRDMIAWVYGSGFPKSLDVSKAIDKAAGAEREKIRKPSAATAYSSAAGNLRPWMERAQELGYTEVDGDQPATDAARQWAGWGTALKPALEPITVARKPLSGTVAATVLEHGTGALNIDGCRVGDGDDKGVWPITQRRHADLTWTVQPVGTDATKGRWPANLIHDGSDEVVGLFPQSKGQQGALTGAEPSGKTANAFGEFAARSPSEPRGDSGSAARFFYSPKASKRDRDEGLEDMPLHDVYTEANPQPDRDNRRQTQRANNHPTVKPTDLMRYLCRLVTPPGGTVLDPFMGSGSTGKAAVLEGFRFIGCERDPGYITIAQARIENAQGPA